MKLSLIILTFAIFMSGCKDEDLIEKNEKSQKEVATLKGLLDTQNQQIDLLKSKVERLEHNDEITQLFIGDLLLKDQRVAVLNIGDTGYKPISHSTGDMVVSLLDVSAFARGSKLKLRFGNPSAANFSGVSAKIEYGPLKQNGSLDEDQINSKTEVFSPDFYPGSWVSVDIVLDKIKPENLGGIRISELNHTNMSLSKTKK